VIVENASGCLNRIFSLPQAAIPFAKIVKSSEWLLTVIVKWKWRPYRPRQGDIIPEKLPVAGAAALGGSSSLAVAPHRWRYRRDP
jgi:hypothetical protein